MLRSLLVIDDYGELVFLQTLMKKVGFDIEGIQSPRAVADAILNFNPELIILTANGKRINGVEIAEGLKKTAGKPKVIILVPSQFMDRFQGLKLPNVDAFVESPVKPTALLKVVSEIGGLDGASLAEKYAKLMSSQGQAEEDNRVMGSQAPSEKEAQFQIVSGDVSSEDQDSHVSGSGARFQLKPEGLRQPSDEAPAEARRRSLEPESSFEDSNEGSEVTKQKPLDKLEPAERARRYKAALDSLETPKFNGLPAEQVRNFHKQIRAQESPKDLKPLEDERKAFVRSLFKSVKK